MAAAQGRLVEIGQAESARGGDRRRLVGDVAILGHEGRGGRAIEEPGVQVRQAVVGGQAPRDRALARCGRAVDGDDHQERPDPLRPIAHPGS